MSSKLGLLDVTNTHHDKKPITFINVFFLTFNNFSILNSRKNTIIVYKIENFKNVLITLDNVIVTPFGVIYPGSPTVALITSLVFRNPSDISLIRIP